MMTMVFASVLPWLLIAIGAWLVYELARQNGRALLRLEAIENLLRQGIGAKERQATRPPQGLPLGEAAPDFELPDLMGVRHNLLEFRGRDVLLMFFNPTCGFCTKMAPDLAALSQGGTGRATPVVVTTGDLEENRRLVEQSGIGCIVLKQDQMEVASLYRAQGTPMGYLIDAEGRIASQLTVGAETLLNLADLKGHERPAPSANRNGSVHKRKEPDPSLARSRLNRSGLKAGDVAPEFNLPRVGGGELSLAELRGKRVLLVFSDPTCGPCDELAPQLQELHVERPDLNVLVISRRDAEATAAKAAAMGLDFPIVMQRQWEISLLYGMFATPSGYLIDEGGIVVNDVAVGVEPILAMADEPSSVAAEIENSPSGKEAALAN